MPKAEAKTATQARSDSALSFVGNSKEDFRQAHDKGYIIPKKINDALAKLGNGRWLYESDFMKLAGGISQTDIGRFRGGFEEFIVTTPGKNPKRAWCGSKELAAELREML